MDARWFRNSFIWLIVMVFVLAIAFQVFRGSGSTTKTVSVTGPGGLVSIVINDAKAHRPITLTQDGSTVTASRAPGTSEVF